MYEIPAIVVLAVAIALAIGIAGGGLVIVHRRFKAESFLPHNEVAGFLIAVAGMVYAVVLGFVTVVVWQQYDETRERLALEASAVTDVWHSAVGYPPSVRTRLRSDMMQYAMLMKNEEWPLMRTGGFSPRGDELLMDAIDSAGTYIPVNPAQTNAQLITIRTLTDIHDARLRRLAGNRSGVSWFEWVVLFVGASVVIIFSYLFGVDNRRVHVTMTSCIAVIIVTLFAMIFELQYPFRGQLGITAEDWTVTLAHIESMDAKDIGNPMHM
ncbi:MAG TPA: hypothetical protein VMD91_08385 [Candidatus Sulfotelmatobacter sp.]|nr:hypothetical protein [Candidatus Sulfotelmatobacter sp.]